MNIPGKYLHIILTATILSVGTASYAQKDNSWSSYPDKIMGLTQQGLEKTSHIIEKYLDEKDSVYVTPNKYRLTLMTQYTNSYEYYRFSAQSPYSTQSITLAPSNCDKLGFYIGWKWIFLGWSFDIDRNSAKNDWNFSFYTSKVGIDLFYRERSEGFRIRALDGFLDKSGNIIDKYNTYFDGISVEQKGVNLYYIFNNKYFSYPAAYSQTTNQRISSGSFLLGFNYSEQSFRLDPSYLDIHIQQGLAADLKFNRIRYKELSINFGYSYNWVFAKDFLANLSLTPAIGYKDTKFRFENGKEFINNINFDFISRAALVYNNTRYFVGLSVVSHTYSYRKTGLSIVNGFGTINVYTGINLFKK